MAWSLRASLAIPFALAIVVVTLAFSVLAVYDGTSNLRDSFLDGQREEAQQAASSIATLLHTSGRSLEGAAAAIPAEKLRPTPQADELGTHLDSVLAYEGTYQTILVVDHVGQPVAARPPGTAVPSAQTLAASAAFARAFTERGSELSLAAAGLLPFWIVPIPDTDTDPDPFFVVGFLRDNALTDGLHASRRGDSDLVLATASGIVVSSTGNLVAGESLADWPAWKELRSGSSDWTDAAPPDGGESVIVSRRALEDGSAEILVMGSTAPIDDLQVTLVRNAILVSLGMAAAAFLVGFFLANRFVRPLHEVQRAADQVRGGDLSARTRPHGPREVKDLATDFNSMAAALQRENWELRTLQGNLEKQVESRTLELQQRNADLDDFAHVVSHDLKAPLRGLSLHLTVLREHVGAKPHPEVRRSLEELDERVQRMGRLIEEILQYSRAGRLRTAPEPVDVSALVRETVELAQPPKGFRIETDIQAAPVVTHRVQLQQVLLNLITNAFRHHDHRRGLIHISARDEGDEIRFEVRDDGPGIPPQLRSGLFEPFQSRNPNKRHSSGVGLPIVKRLVESCGGQLELDPQEGRGTTFRFTWPRPAKTNGNGSKGARPAPPEPVVAATPTPLLGPRPESA